MKLITSGAFLYLPIFSTVLNKTFKRIFNPFYAVDRCFPVWSASLRPPTKENAVTLIPPHYHLYKYEIIAVRLFLMAYNYEFIIITKRSIVIINFNT